ncbi:MAG: hypothetical protein ACLP22_06125 [Solirubrobacteraceae bacterium]
MNVSTRCTSSLLTFPAGTFPGQRIRHGARFEPSSEVDPIQPDGADNSILRPA